MTLVVVEMLNEEEHKGGIGNESDTVNTMEQTILQQDGDDLNASNAPTSTYSCSSSSVRPPFLAFFNRCRLRLALGDNALSPCANQGYRAVVKTQWIGSPLI